MESGNPNRKSKEIENHVGDIYRKLKNVKKRISDRAFDGAVEIKDVATGKKVLNAVEKIKHLAKGVVSHEKDDATSRGVDEVDSSASEKRTGAEVAKKENTP